MIDPLTLTALLGIAVCCVFSMLAKRSAPITQNDARVIWAMHKTDSGCKHGKWRFIRHRENKIVGFECGCGYKYQQKRPLFSRMPKA